MEQSTLLQCNYCHKMLTFIKAYRMWICTAEFFSCKLMKKFVQNLVQAQPINSKVDIFWLPAAGKLPSMLPL